MVFPVWMFLVPKSIIRLFVGKPFSTRPTSQTAEEVVAALRKRADKNCECLFDDGVLEIDVLPQPFSTNPNRTIFRGQFEQGAEGASLVGKFRYGLSYQIFVLAAFIWALFQGLTSGKIILAILMPFGALWVLGIHAWLMEYLNVTREAKIRQLLDSVFEAGNSERQDVDPLSTPR